CCVLLRGVVVNRRSTVELAGRRIRHVEVADVVDRTGDRHRAFVPSERQSTAALRGSGIAGNAARTLRTRQLIIDPQRLQLVYQDAGPAEFRAQVPRRAYIQPAPRVVS